MRTSVSAFLLGLFLAAGCLDTGPGVPDEAPTAASFETAVVHTAGGIAAPREAYTGELPVFELRYVNGMPGFEPSVAITSTGTAFFNSHTLRLPDYPATPPMDATKVLRTTDQGLSWEDVTPTAAGMEVAPWSFDPLMELDPDTDRLFNVDLYLYCTWLSFSDDEGETWTTSPFACGAPPQDHQNFFTARPRLATTVGYPNVAYVCYNTWVTTVACTRSLDGGQTFAALPPVFTEPEGDARFVPTGRCGFVATGRGASAPDGSIFIPHVWCNETLVEVSRDDGLTWKRFVVDDTKGGAPGFIDNHDASLAADTDGILYIGWIGADGLPWLSVSRDVGDSWEPPMMVAPPGITGVTKLAVTAIDPGRVAIQYMATNVTGGWKADAADKESQEWNGYVTMSLNADDPEPVFATAQVNPLGDPLRRGPCEVVCGEGRSATYDFLDVQASTSTGQVWTAFVDVCLGACAEPGSDISAPGGNLGAVGVQVAGETLKDRGTG